MGRAPRRGAAACSRTPARPGDPAIQALVRWEPVPFLLAEAARRAEAGFPPGHAVFRVTARVSSDELEKAMAGAGARPC